VQLDLEFSFFSELGFLVFSNPGGNYVDFSTAVLQLVAYLVFLFFRMLFHEQDAQQSPSLLNAACSRSSRTFRIQLSIVQ